MTWPPSLLGQQVTELTGPIRNCYFMLSSTELQSDFDGLTGSGVFNNWNYPKICGVVKSSLIDLEFLAMAA